MRVLKITNGDIVFNKATDTLDIVCHSFGFAYAQGMIEIFKLHNFTLGSYYILAPENACSGSVDLTNFKGNVWQYGSNLGMTNTNIPIDPVWEQDGVAPQCDVGNINSNSNKAGRIGTPPNPGFSKCFTESHYIKNFGWIFNITTPKGYVKKRN